MISYKQEMIHGMIIGNQEILNCISCVFNRPVVAGFVLQTPLLLIDWLNSSLSDGLWKYLQNTFSLKPEELGSWKFERRLTSPYLSRVTCHLSHVTSCFRVGMVFKDWIPGQLFSNYKLYSKLKHIPQFILLQYLNVLFPSTHLSKAMLHVKTSATRLW